MTIQPPPDPAAPLRLLQAGRADAVVSYEPELLLARDQGADLVGVGALVQKPLTSLISLGDDAIAPPRRPARQEGRHRRHPVPVGLPADDPRRRRARPGRGRGGQRRLQPHAGDDLRQGRRDARLVLELRGRRPRAAQPQAADPAHGAARRADLQRADLRRPPRRPRPRACVASAPLPARHGPRAPDRARAAAGGRRRAPGGRRRARPRAPGRRDPRDAAGLLPRGRRSCPGATRTSASGRPTSSGCAATACSSGPRASARR